jgi:anthranilate phosphoribosyltransferase
VTSEAIPEATSEVTREVTSHSDPRSWKALLGALLAGRTLSAEDTRWAMTEIMSGAATSAQIAGFAVALRAKGADAAEMTGLAESMLSFAEPIAIAGHAVDLVGTGGDGAHTVNISTMGAIVAAGAGARIVKHGNRAASSMAGGADTLEALGVNIDLLGPAVARCVAELGIGFCFAARFHPAFRFTATARSELGIPTPFNFLGPLTNPAQPPASAVGCADLSMAPVLAEVLAARGGTALVFRGDDGLDELTTTTTSRLWAVHGGTITESVLNPIELGVPRASIEDLRGGDASYNAGVARAVFGGERGPVRDAVVLNAAAAIAAHDGLPDGPVTALRVGIARAATAIDSGAAAGLLDRWVALTRQLATDM